MNRPQPTAINLPPAPAARCDRVFRIANHDEALHIWREAGVSNQVLVHIDAHHDLWPVGEGELTIANFLCPALHEKIVRELYWVVPDGAFATSHARRHVIRHLKKLIRGYKGPAHPIGQAADVMRTEIAGVPLTVCTIASLPALPDPVLLDIDTDFLVIPRVTFADADVLAPVPWIWPDELLRALAGKLPRAEIATIAESVEGGYTPLQWKYLAEELLLRLRGGAAPSQFDAVDLMRQAATAADFALAERLYLSASKLWAESAAPWLQLSHLYAAEGLWDQARDAYARALRLDASCDTCYNSAGPKLSSYGRFAAAEVEYRRMLKLYPDDAYSHLGQGWLALERRRWLDAESHLRRALQLRPDLVDAHRDLGHALAHMGRTEDALQAYDSCLKLVLTGHRPLTSPIASCSEHVMMDPYHGQVHAARARLQERLGRLAEALRGYQMALAFKYEVPWVHVRLARLYMRSGEWGGAIVQLWRALVVLPPAIRRDVRWKWRKLRGAFDRAAARSAAEAG